jgi:alkylation response protein AidB-like acyl-CoA dehydrogenase
MVENNVVQSHVAQSEARWRSARYFLHAAADEALETIEECGEMDLDQRTRLRLASTWAIQSSREIVNTLFHDCGSMAVFEENPFERRLRDIDTVAQQGQGAYCTTRRSVRSCLACRPRIFSSFAQAIP